MSNFFKSKFFIAMCCVALFTAGFFLYSVTNAEGAAIGKAANSIISIFQGAFSSAGNFFVNLKDGIFNYGNLKDENSDLKAQLAELQKQIDENSDLYKEIDNYKRLMGITDYKYDFDIVEASVISKADENWYSVFNINRGTNVGIGVGNAVISGDGLVGIVTEVGSNWSTVTSIIDPISSVGGIILKTGDIAVIDGNMEYMKKGQCIFNLVDVTAKISRDDIVYTSGLGRLIPEGLRVGKISSVHSSETGAYQYAVITPSVDFSSLRDVYIIKEYTLITEEVAEK